MSLKGTVRVVFDSQEEDVTTRSGESINRRIDADRRGLPMLGREPGSALAHRCHGIGGMQAADGLASLPQGVSNRPVLRSHVVGIKDCIPKHVVEGRCHQRTLRTQDIHDGVNHCLCSTLHPAETGKGAVHDHILNPVEPRLPERAHQVGLG
jgi:hypothetical protein